VILDANGVFVERNPIHRVLSGSRTRISFGRSAGTSSAGAHGHRASHRPRNGDHRGELLAPNFDGTRTPIEVSVFSILNDAGEVLYYVGIGRDITERKRAETALQSAHDALEERVEARTRELARLNETLLTEVAERKQAEEAIRRSHELLSKQNAVLADFSKRLNPEGGDPQSLMGELDPRRLDHARRRAGERLMYREAESAIECPTSTMPPPVATSRTAAAGVDFPSYFRALGEHRAIAAHDAHLDPRTREFSSSYLTPLGITAMLDAPIWLEGKMVGVICNEHVALPDLDPEEERFAASVADSPRLPSRRTSGSGRSRTCGRPTTSSRPASNRERRSSRG
jgi:hypothetical protein